MKIERISDNQIRCTLNKEDLAGKEMLLNELAFSPDKAKGLFRELMQKASAELGFEASDNPLMVEAIPVSKECLVLVITKVDNPDDMQDHYKKLTRSISPEHLHVLGDNSQLLDLFEDADKAMKDLDDTMKSALSDSSVQIYCFHTLDDVAKAAKLVRDFQTDSCLYKDPVNQCYYLSISLPVVETSNQTLNQIHAILSEYCRRLPNTYATTAFFQEHLTTIVKEHAIETMAEF